MITAADISAWLLRIRHSFCRIAFRPRLIVNRLCRDFVVPDACCRLSSLTRRAHRSPLSSVFTIVSHALDISVRTSRKAGRPLPASFGNTFRQRNGGSGVRKTVAGYPAPWTRVQKR